MNTEPPQTTPTLSALVVIPDQFDTVRDTMRALQAQTLAAHIEIVFIIAALDVAVPLDALRSFHSSQTIVVPFGSIGQAFVVGIRHARAPLIALTEDHSFPEPHWAERLVAAHQTNHAIVAPAMRNGNPDHIVSWADFFIAYSKWADPIQSQTMDFLPGHNSVYRRSVLEPYLARLEEWFEAETVLHWELRRQGHSLWLEGSTYTSHLNFAQWGIFLRAHSYAGRNFGAQRAAPWRWSKRFVYGLAAPLIPLVRFLRVRREMQRAQFDLLLRVRIYAAILAGLVSDALGQGLGYFTGKGARQEQNMEHEFHRTQYANL
jgi:hypothetical protein